MNPQYFERSASNRPCPCGELGPGHHHQTCVTARESERGQFVGNEVVRHSALIKCDQCERTSEYMTVVPTKTWEKSNAD